MAMPTRVHPLISFAPALLLAGCACFSDASAPAPAPVTAAYACDDGMRFTAEFDPAASRLVVTRPGGAPTVMEQTVSASGIRYTDGTNVFHAKGRKAFWITGGTRLVGCHEVARG